MEAPSRDKKPRSAHLHSPIKLAVGLSKIGEPKWVACGEREEVHSMHPKGDREQAYRNYKRGMTHKENALTQGVSENTVKSWCMRYKWAERKNLDYHKNLDHLFLKRLHRRDA